MTTNKTELNFKALKKLYDNKLRILFYGLAGLLISLALVGLFPPKKYTLEFTIQFNHILFKNFLNYQYIGGIRSLLNKSKVNNNEPILLMYDRPSSKFIARSNDKNLKNKMESFLNDSISEEVDHIINILKTDPSKIINIHPTHEKINHYTNGVINWHDSDIVKLDPSQIKESLVIHFGKVKSSNYVYYSALLGLLIGVYIASLLILIKK